jgi:hypothetical protein
MHRGTSPTDKESPWPYARSSARVDHLIESRARPSQDRSDVFLEEAAAARHFIQDRKNIGGSLDAPDHLMPTYESSIVHRESWLPPFPFTRRYDRDRDATGRFEE